ncbi:MAG: alkaline phosphatase family protein [Nitrososphaerales archaeon]
MSALSAANSSKVLVVGFDGATFDIIKPMIAQGRLKHLAKLMGRGSSGNLRSTILPLSSVAWSSFVSGKNPAKHGMYDFSKRAKGSYSSVPVTSRDRGTKAIWHYASEAGKKCLIVNVPLTYPPDKLNGVMISGFPYLENKRDYAWPRTTIDEINAKLGDASILKPNPQFLKDGDERKIFEEVNEITRRQTKILKYLIERERWDLVTTVYDATDVISHFFWHHLDQNHPKHDAEKAKIYGPMVYDVYEELDQAFGNLEAMFSEKDHIFVISDHGFGPVYHAIYMNNWLIQNNYLRLRRTAGTRARKALFDLGVTSEFLFNAVKKLHIVGTKTNTYSKNSKKVALAKKLTLSTDDIDWKSTLAYASGNYGPIYINLRGREPEGRVARGEEYENLVEELVQKLGGVIEPGSGRKLFDLIYTKDRIYSGPYYDEAPDIMYFDSTWLYYPLRVFEFGNKNMIAPNPIYTGAHRMEGIFLGAGEGINHKADLSMNLIDLAPTILHLLNLPIPPSIDGRVLNEILLPEFEPSDGVLQKGRLNDHRLFEIAAQTVVSSNNARF